MLSIFNVAGRDWILIEKFINSSCLPVHRRLRACDFSYFSSIQTQLSAGGLQEVEHAKNRNQFNELENLYCWKNKSSLRFEEKKKNHFISNSSEGNAKKMKMFFWKIAKNCWEVFQLPPTLNRKKNLYSFKNQVLYKLFLDTFLLSFNKFDNKEINIPQSRYNENAYCGWKSLEYFHSFSTIAPLRMSSKWELIEK